MLYTGGTTGKPKGVVIDPQELEEIINEGEDISVSCQFCDREYSFTPAELGAMLAEKK